MLHLFTRLPIGFVPMDWKTQPMAVGETANQIVRVVGERPLGLLPDVARPEVLTLKEMSREWKQARDRNNRRRSASRISILSPHCHWIPMPTPLDDVLQHDHAVLHRYAGDGDEADGRRYRQVLLRGRRWRDSFI